MILEAGCIRSYSRLQIVPHDRENSTPALIYNYSDALPRLLVDLSAFHEYGEQLDVNGTGQLDRGDTNYCRYPRPCGWRLSLSFGRLLTISYDMARQLTVEASSHIALQTRSGSAQALLGASAFFLTCELYQSVVLICSLRQCGCCYLRKAYASAGHCFQVGNINVPSSSHKSFYQMFPLLGKLDQCAF